MSEWKASNEPRPKKPRRFQSKKKAMLTVFMDYIIHYEFLPESQTVKGVLFGHYETFA